MQTVVNLFGFYRFQAADLIYARIRHLSQYILRFWILIFGEVNVRVLFSDTDKWRSKRDYVKGQFFIRRRSFYL